MYVQVGKEWIIQMWIAQSCNTCPYNTCPYNTLINFYGNQNNVSKATNIFKSIKLVSMQ